MARNLRPKIQRFFDFISQKRSGDIVTAAEVMTATGWPRSTFTTHLRKNGFDPFLMAQKGDRFWVRRDGNSITKDEVARALTQIRPSDELVLLKGVKVKGEVSSYELDALMGRGAVAQVWRATKTIDGSPRAVKICDPRPDLLEPSILPNVKQRFSREARNGRKLDHPHIVKYRDLGEFKEHPFIVMDLADESLGAMLKAGRKTVSESMEVVDAVCSGLTYLHSVVGVHRDIKPDNILRFGTQYVLGDLGIVKWSDLNPAFTSAATITRASLQLGSFHYMAPEQRLNSPHDVTHKSDIYALGVSWYEILTGMTPDPAAVGAQEFDDPSKDTELNALIRSMLKYRPAERPETNDIQGFIKARGTR